MDQQFPSFASISMDDSPALALPFEYNAAVAFVDDALQDGRGNCVAIRTANRNWIYADLGADVNRVGNVLHALGVDMEQRVALFLHDSPEFACTFFGAMKIGAVPIPTNTSLRPQDYRYMLNDSRARVLVVEADLWPQIAPLRPELPFLRHVVTVQRGAAPHFADGTLDYSVLIVEILDGIGSTEVLHIFISNVPGAAVPGSSGRVVPGYEARIVDEQGRPVPQGELGSLLVSGDSICSQYWNKHERTKSTLIGTWIRTGDQYYQDEHGNYWYGGRSDDMLKVSGQWVSPAEVEAALMTHPNVLEAAVVGREDDKGLIKPQAFVVLRDGVEPTETLADELKQYVKTSLLPVKYPRWIEFIPELPKTATGKIQRYRLREWLSKQAESDLEGRASDGASQS